MVGRHFPRFWDGLGPLNYCFGLFSSFVCVLTTILHLMRRAIGAWCAALPGTRRTKPVICSPVASTARPSAGTSTSLPCCRRSDTFTPPTHMWRVLHKLNTANPRNHDWILEHVLQCHTFSRFNLRTRSRCVCVCVIRFSASSQLASTVTVQWSSCLERVRKTQVYFMDILHIYPCAGHIVWWSLVTPFLRLHDWNCDSWILRERDIAEAFLHGLALLHSSNYSL